VNEGLVAAKPANLTSIEASAVPLSGCTALQAIRDHAKVRPGDRVLIIGASGGVGTFAVQLARAFGGEVTGVCSTRNLSLVRSLGADRVIDYTAGDPVGGDDRYDAIVQLAGTASAASLRRALTPRGRLLQLSGDSGNRLVGPMGRILAGRLLSAIVPQTISSFTVRPNAPDLDVLRHLIEAGSVRTVIDRTFALDDIHAAFVHVEAGHPRGKAIVAVSRALTDTDHPSTPRSTAHS
jgi:NADPH:quinone reductase-like Zn-dependent oxidoreductase